MYYYRFHIGDYKKSTDHLTNGEDLAYRRLLDMYYESEKPIPLDTQWVARRLRVDLQDVEIVLEEFFVKAEAGFVHQYCEKQIAAYNKRANANKTNGAKGGRRKTENPLGSDSVTHSVPNGNPSETHQASLTNNQEPITNKKSNTPNKFDDPMFDLFWDTFADKRGRGGAEKVWKRINPDHELAKQIIEGAKRYAQSRGKDRQYWKQAQGWLNDRRWEDDVSVQQTIDSFDDISNWRAWA